MYILKKELKLTEEQKEMINNKVLSLPSEEKLAIYLYFWKEFSHLQIARDLGMSVCTISQLIENAMLRLRRDFFEIASEYFETYLPSASLNNYRE
jgi:RNA polymerase sigma factor (sigma-70 family)